MKEGDLVILTPTSSDEIESHIGVFIKYIHSSPDLIPILGDISGWECLVSGKSGVYLKPYWEIRKWES